jgi:hypothetical protein
MNEALETQPERLEEWRRSAQRVTRAWNSWLAAERRDERALYHTFVLALADEEDAAARAQLIIQAAAVSESATPTHTEIAG